VNRWRPSALFLGSVALLCLLGFAPGTVLAQRDESTLQRVKREGVLRWGADPSGGAPHVYYDPNDPDRIIGFEVDLMAALAKRLGVRPELVRGDWATLIDSLKARRVDVVLNGLEVNPGRAKAVAFTYPYYVYQQQLTVREGDKDVYRTLDDLKGKVVAVLNGSASADVLRQAGWPAGLIREYDDSLTPYNEVRLKRADAALAESIIAKYYAARDPELFNVPQTFKPGQYAAAVRKGDRDLLDALNAALKGLSESGELGEIYRKGKVWTADQETLGITPPAAAEAPEAEGEPEGAPLWTVALPALLWASLTTLLLTALSMPLALLVGLGLALMARSRRWWLSAPARTYIQVVRGTPLLVQVFLIYYSLPQLGQALGLGGLFTLDNFVVGVICLAANYAAYEAEIHRAGLEAVPRGQREAALSLGMSERQAFIHVVLPQSFRIILPPVLNDLISMLKDSCLVSVIGVRELLGVAYGIGKANFEVPQMLAIAAAIYLVLSLAADWLGKRLEARLRRRGVASVAGHAPRH
jgi:polar amino acid transport system substrate-binding protein